ncbi:4-alpha-glucanotransferase [Gandjariella thermophila]|uniref:4-alpha-glucanotransferase n=1 Tax=Gandjariella thermophila TaxID=1931992 RepID=A0A4D4J3X7_9PSEU|nr:4-alpha-glucanotransferase [Gandjariella thermophila]GDY28673.1 4-alpha-glucanotransferase [Gandjariella thermophila]
MDEDLAELAEAMGVATSYENHEGRRVRVDPAVVVAVLAELGVDAGGPAAVRDALAALRDRRRRGRLPPAVVVRQGEARWLPGRGVVRLESGCSRPVDGRLPRDLPLGWHRLAVAEQEVTLVVAPRALPPPPPAWGWMLQLYAVHSAGSWGIGDLADLRELARWSGRRLGAGALLVNPLHAVTPVLPVEPSPYSPSSRRFANPLYLRIEDTAEYAAADPDTRRAVDALRPHRLADRVEYDRVWWAKRRALELLRPAGIDLPDRADLLDFATFCALAERYGPRWRDWPPPLRHPGSPAVAEARAQLADRVAFHAWVQRLCAAQLDAAQRAARDAGMPIGVLHDLAVGVDPHGADAWALQDVLAGGVTVGAPPDAFNQRGQDWGLPPWHPVRLAEAGYRPFRDVLRAGLAHGGGLRVDHVAGLWRLWWIPRGGSPEHGSYVRYDADALLGVLALEAYRAGAVVIGEDLGTVEERVRTALREMGALGSAVLWFTRGPDGRLLPPEAWPERAAASVSTHDLPTATGFLRGEHVEVRAELGVLARDPERERRAAAEERHELLDLLRTHGLLGPQPERADEQDVVLAMHRLLARTPCRLLLAAPADAIGEVRQPNLPGTVHEYPNWRIPLPVTLEELMADPRVHRVAAALRATRPGEAPGTVG